MKCECILFALCFFVMLIPYSYAQSSLFNDEKIIPIAKSQDMDNVIFDGKWSFPTEWKPSSWTKLSYNDGSLIHFRSAHYGDYMYLFVNFQTDTTLDNHMDKTTLCIDSKNDKSSVVDQNDYCFSVSLNQKQGRSFQGGSLLKQNGFLKQVDNHPDFVAISSTSDSNDKYSSVPHSSYEFRIPIELIERSNSYGLFLSVYDASSNSFYNWPQNVTRESHFEIPSPKEWGELISPDKSIPEFQTPIFAFLLLLPAIVILKNYINKKGF